MDNHNERNPIAVILRVDSQAVEAHFLSKYCGVYMVEKGKPQWLFMQCATAEPSGEFLEVSIEDDAGSVRLLIPARLVLWVSFPRVPPAARP